MSGSASGALVAFMLAASHSTRFPRRMGNTPTSSDSVNGAEYQKPALASSGLPAMQASTHSFRCPGLRGSVGGGGVKELIKVSGTRRGAPDQPGAMRLPLAPTK